MSLLSARVQNMTESATLAMAKLSRALREKGVDVINLSLGEPDFDTPQNIKDAAIAALQAGDTKYPPVAGTKALKDAICAKFKRENNLEYQPENIIVSTGAKQSIFNACMALLNEGDEIVLPAPYWISYAAIAELCGAVVVELPTTVERHFKFTRAQLESAITPKTKVILYSSPCNPTGAVYHRAELEALRDVLLQNPQIVVISDEIYEHINFMGGHESLAQFPEIKDRVVVVNGFSKAYAMTGWRLGYMAASAEIVSACDKIQGQVTSGACSFNQAAGAEALNGGQDSVRAMSAKFLERRDLAFGRIEKIADIQCTKPDGAFYLFPNVSAYFGKKYDGFSVHNSEDMALYLLQYAHVATVGGMSFGDANCIRLSFAASSESLSKAFDRIEKALAQLS